MNTVWVIAIVGFLVGCIGLGAAAWFAQTGGRLAALGGLRRGGPEERTLVRRILRLPVRCKLRLALALVRDSRIHLAVRAIPPGLILYLATPIDVIPDFIPVLGHVDDVIILVVGVGLLLRFTPRDVLEEHVSRLETGEASV